MKSMPARLFLSPNKLFNPADYTPLKWREPYVEVLTGHLQSTPDGPTWNENKSYVVICPAQPGEATNGQEEAQEMGDD